MSFSWLTSVYADILNYIIFWRDLCFLVFIFGIYYVFGYCKALHFVMCDDDQYYVMDIVGI